MEPSIQNTKHNTSVQVERSLVIRYAPTTVHTRSVACNKTCVDAETNCNPKLVQLYFKPNKAPIGTHHCTFHQKYGPPIQDCSEDKDTADAEDDDKSDNARCDDDDDEPL